MKKHIGTLFITTLLLLTIAFTANAQTNQENDKKQSVNTPLKIIRKPVAEVSTCGQSSGIVQLKATFDKSAKVTDVVVTKSSGCKDFDNNAIRAARGIKFKPATKDGEAVTVSKPLEYQFRIF